MTGPGKEEDLYDSNRDTENDSLRRPLRHKGPTGSPCMYGKKICNGRIDTSIFRGRLSVTRVTRGFEESERSIQYDKRSKTTIERERPVPNTNLVPLYPDPGGKMDRCSDPHGPSDYTSRSAVRLSDPCSTVGRVVAQYNGTLR